MRYALDKHPEMIMLKGYLGNLRTKGILEFNRTLVSLGLNEDQRVVIERYFGGRCARDLSLIGRGEYWILDSTSDIFKRVTEEEGNVSYPLGFQRNSSSVSNVPDNSDLVSRLREDVFERRVTLKQLGLGDKESSVFETYFGSNYESVDDAPIKDRPIIERLVGAYWRFSKKDGMMESRRDRRHGQKPFEFEPVKRKIKPYVPKPKETRILPTRKQHLQVVVNGEPFLHVQSNLRPKVDTEPTYGLQYDESILVRMLAKLHDQGEGISDDELFALKEHIAHNDPSAFETIFVADAIAEYEQLSDEE